MGFGFGDAVIVELLRSKSLLPPLSESKHLDVLVALTEDNHELYARAIGIASQLREKGYRVDLLMQSKRMKGILQAANRMHVDALIVFSTHEGEGNALVKCLVSGTQQIVSDSALFDTIQSIKKKDIN